MSLSCSYIAYRAMNSMTYNKAINFAPSAPDALTARLLFWRYEDGMILVVRSGTLVLS